MAYTIVFFYIGGFLHIGYSSRMDRLHHKMVKQLTLNKVDPELDFNLLQV